MPTSKDKPQPPVSEFVVKSGGLRPQWFNVFLGNLALIGKSDTARYQDERTLVHNGLDFDLEISQLSHGPTSIRAIPKEGVTLFSHQGEDDDGQPLWQKLSEDRRETGLLLSDEKSGNTFIQQLTEGKKVSRKQLKTFSVDWEFKGESDKWYVNTRLQEGNFESKADSQQA